MVRHVDFSFSFEKANGAANICVSRIRPIEPQTCVYLVWEKGLCSQRDEGDLEIVAFVWPMGRVRPRKQARRFIRCASRHGSSLIGTIFLDPI